MRDKKAHHCFDVEAGFVFAAIKEDVPCLLSTVGRIIQDVLISFPL